MQLGPHISQQHTAQNIKSGSDVLANNGIAGMSPSVSDGVIGEGQEFHLALSNANLSIPEPSEGVVLAGINAPLPDSLSTVDPIISTSGPQDIAVQQVPVGPHKSADAISVPIESVLTNSAISNVSNSPTRQMELMPHGKALPLATANLLGTPASPDEALSGQQTLAPSMRSFDNVPTSKAGLANVAQAMPSEVVSIETDGQPIAAVGGKAEETPKSPKSSVLMSPSNAQITPVKPAVMMEKRPQLRPVSKAVDLGIQGTAGEIAPARTIPLPTSTAAESIDQMNPPPVQVKNQKTDETLSPAPVENPLKNDTNAMARQAVLVPSPIAPPTLLASDPTVTLRDAQPLERLVDTITQMREAGQAGRGEVTLKHNEFGNISMRITAGDGELNARLASRDPAFLAAAQMALAERAVAERQVTSTSQSENNPSNSRNSDSGQSSQSNARDSGSSMQQGTQQGRENSGHREGHGLSDAAPTGEHGVNASPADDHASATKGLRASDAGSLFA